MKIQVHYNANKVTAHIGTRIVSMKTKGRDPKAVRDAIIALVTKQVQVKRIA